MVAWESIKKAEGRYREVKALWVCNSDVAVVTQSFAVLYRAGLNALPWSRWNESFTGACLLIVSLLSCSLEVVRNSDSLLVGLKWSVRIILKLCFWKLVFGCFLQPCGTQLRKRLQRFLSHVFLSQLGLSFFTFYFPRQRKKIQMTNRQIQKPLWSLPYSHDSRLCSDLLDSPLQKALTRLCDMHYLTLCSSSKDWFQHTASLYDSRYHIPFSYPVNLYSSCLCMLASGASLVGVFYRLAEGCCSGICWYRFFWNLFRAWLVKGSRLLQLICQK